MDEISNSFPKTSPDKISFKIAPKITGITIKKENFALSLLLFPKNKDVDIVAPDLDIPGKIAKACETPIIRESVFDI